MTHLRPGHTTTVPRSLTCAHLVSLVIAQNIRACPCCHTSGNNHIGGTRHHDQAKSSSNLRPRQHRRTIRGRPTPRPSRIRHESRLVRHRGIRRRRILRQQDSRPAWNEALGCDPERPHQDAGRPRPRSAWSLTATPCQDHHDVRRAGHHIDFVPRKHRLEHSSGRMIAGIFSVLADYELSIIRDRTKLECGPRKPEAARSGRRSTTSIKRKPPDFGTRDGAKSESRKNSVWGSDASTNGSGRNTLHPRSAQLTCDQNALHLPYRPAHCHSHTQPATTTVYDPPLQQWELDGIVQTSRLRTLDVGTPDTYQADQVLSSSKETPLGHATVKPSCPPP